MRNKVLNLITVATASLAVVACGESPGDGGAEAPAGAAGPASTTESGRWVYVG